MKKLLQIIKNNDRDLIEKFEKYPVMTLDWKEDLENGKEAKEWIKGQVVQSRIKELEALVEMIEEYKEENQGIFPFPTEGGAVCDDIIKILQDTIKQLKN